MKVQPIPLSERLESCGAGAPDLNMFHVQAKALARTLDEMTDSGDYFQTQMKNLVLSLYRPEDEDIISLHILIFRAQEYDDDVFAEKLLRFILLDPFTRF